MDLKQEMVAYFDTPEVHDLIVDYLNKHNLDYSSLDDDELIKILEQLQVLDPIINKVESVPQKQLEDIEIQNKSKTLRITLERGRGFSQWKKIDDIKRFFISVSGFSQKHKTNTYKINENFSVGEQLHFNLILEEMKPQNCEQLHLAVIGINQEGKKQLLAVKLIQWRFVLSTGTLNFEIELAPYNFEGLSELPTFGILSLKLNLYPLSKLNLVQEKSIQREIQYSRKNLEQINNSFYKYAGQFWNQYKSINRSFQTRRIKIYGDSQDKVLIPLNRFIYPLYNVYGIDSPQHALRFCSLIPFEEERLNRPSIYKRFHSILAGMKGSVDDHAHLLCSLLLGFGLKAYVALGESIRGNHAWVLTEDTKNGSMIFWECTKGARYDYYSKKTHEFYRTIHVVYNHQTYFANIQLDDSVIGTKFAFKDRNLWKKMDESFLNPTPLYNTPIRLCTPTYDALKIQTEIERNLAEKVKEFRRINKLGWKEDQVLGSILRIALTNYEVERVTGLTFCEDEFQNAIKNHIPSKHTFKAFPIQLTTLDPSIILQTLKNQQKCREIMLAQGDSIYFAIKAKLILYPDNIFALWISLAARYYKID